jgi:formyltetrahydrofolate deformylase
MPPTPGVTSTSQPCRDYRLIADRDAGALRGELTVALSNHTDLEPVARDHGIPFSWCPSNDKAKHEDFLVERLAAYKPDLVVLAGYMQILIPYHPGPNAYRQAWEEGVRVSGCTAHFVTEQLDAGPVVLQDVFHIRVGEDTLAKRSRHAARPSKRRSSRRRSSCS